MKLILFLRTSIGEYALYEGPLDYSPMCPCMVQVGGGGVGTGRDSSGPLGQSTIGTNRNYCNSNGHIGGYYGYTTH